jgi:HAD superfamily hydrolase (TIGR01549 family)
MHRRRQKLFANVFIQKPSLSVLALKALEDFDGLLVCFLIFSAEKHMLHWRFEGKEMATTKVVSFDLDSTLIEACFADSVWLEGIPSLYSVKSGVSFEDAKRTVKEEYERVGKQRLEWYDLQYWIEKFDLNALPRELLESFSNRVKVFPDVPHVLAELKHRGFRLVVVTNGHREFLDFELSQAKINCFFERVFSSTSDFGLVKKTVTPYQKVCNILDVSPEEMVHVGDDVIFDFDVPKRLGILAFHLDRKGEHEGEFVVRSLTEFGEKLRKLGM